MYQQRWRSKRFLRGYHGDWIGERRFRRWYLPTSVPRIEVQGRGNEKGMTEHDRLPVITLFLRDVERRLDTVVHRCCFARSAREARALIVQGKVKLNGIQTRSAGTLLNPGDLLSVEANAVPMLSKDLAKGADGHKEADLPTKGALIASMQSKEGENVASSSTADHVSAEEKIPEAATQTPSSHAESSERSQEAHDSIFAKEKKGKRKAEHTKDKDLLQPGVLPFSLPPFAAPFLFVPPYLEVSFTTCSAIYIRHPTITPANPGQKQQVLYHTDIPSPYPATGDMYSLAWEMYARDAPRIRSDVRRLRLEARIGRTGMRTARAKDQWRKVLAIRRKRDRQANSSTQSDDVLLKGIVAQAGSEGKQRKMKQFTVGRKGRPVQKRTIPSSKVSIFSGEKHESGNNDTIRAAV